MQYLIHQRKRSGAPADQKSTEPEKPVPSPRSGTAAGLLSFLFTNKEDKPGSTPPLPAVPTAPQTTESAPSPRPAASIASDAPAIDRPLSPLPVAAIPREASKGALSALLGWGSGTNVTAEESSSSSGRKLDAARKGDSGRALAVATPPPASQPEKPSESLPPSTRSALGFGTLFRGSWGEKKDAPAPIDPKVVETMQREIKCVETVICALRRVQRTYRNVRHPFARLSRVCLPLLCQGP